MGEPATADHFLDDRAFNRGLRRSTAKLVTFLLAPILVLLGMVLYQQRSARRLDHTDLVIGEANHVEKLLMTMQSNFRGYRLLKEPELVDLYEKAHAEIPGRLQNLAALIANTPRKAEAVAAVTASTQSWMTYTDISLARMKTGATADSQRPYLIPARPLITGAVEGVHAFLAEEEAERAERLVSYNLVSKTVMGGFAGAVLLGVPFLLWWLLRRLRAVGASYSASVQAAEQHARELRVTLKSIGDAVIATDAAGRVAFLNPVAETLTGWPSAEARGRPLGEVFDIISEQTGRAAENPVDRVLSENVVVGLANHTVLRSRDGRRYPIEDSAAPIRGDTGVLGVILVFHDVTHKRAADQQLRENERKLRFLDDLAAATRDLLLPGEIMAASTHLLGRELGVARCAYGEVHPDQEHFTIFDDYAHGCPPLAGTYALADFGAGIAASLRAGRTLVIRDVTREPEFSQDSAAFTALNIEATICYPLQKDGVLLALMAVHSSSPRTWTPGEQSLVSEVVERCWATIERARAEADARERGRLSALRADVAGAFDSAEPLPRTLQACSELIVRHIDAAFVRIWTLEPAADELVLRASAGLDTHLDGAHARIRLGDFKIGRIALERRPHFTNDLANDPNFSDPEWAQREGLVSFAGYPLLVERQLVGVLGLFARHPLSAVETTDLDTIARTISQHVERKRSEVGLQAARDTAERANRAKDDFLATLSHELRTPLTPVLITASELRRDERLPGEVRDQLRMMERNIALEARLIDDLLDLTSISRGKLQLRAQDCDAHALIGLAIEIVRSDAQAKSIAILRDFRATLFGLSADPARFQQVIWNLLRNAVKFTPPHGQITILTTNDSGADGSAWLRIEVADSGIGLDPNMLNQIFLPFDQGMLAGDHRFGGVGLGLAIARAVVELHHGLISAQSPGPNQGATFVVDLPGARQATPETRTPEPAPGSAPASVRPLRLLLVEDHENTLQSLTQLLRARGHHVAPASSVKAALAAAASQPFDLVVSDLGLPDGTGTELMTRLRADYRLRGIALSGYGLEDDLARSRQAGFEAHLVKPVSFADLHRLILQVAPR